MTIMVYSWQYTERVQYRVLDTFKCGAHYYWSYVNTMTSSYLWGLPTAVAYAFINKFKPNYKKKFLLTQIYIDCLKASSKHPSYFIWYVSNNMLNVIHCRHSNHTIFNKLQFFYTAIFLHFNICPTIIQKFINLTSLRCLHESIIINYETKTTKYPAHFKKRVNK